MPPSERRDGEPRPTARRASDGPFGGLLNQIPLESRLAVTIGVVAGLFASIVLSGAGDLLSTIALWIGVGGGVAVASALWFRARRRVRGDAPTDREGSRTMRH